MNITERALAFASAFPKWQAAWPVVRYERVDRGVLYAVWVLGNDYRARSKIYGAYPPNYLKRVRALFPGVASSRQTVLHAFSGSLRAGPYSRCDSARRSEYQCDVLELPHRIMRPFELVYADPPYSKADAARYGTTMIHRGKVLRALAQVTQVDGHLVWLDTVWPMHRKTEWVTVGRIAVVRSTGHRVRLCSIFRRVGT